MKAITLRNIPEPLARRIEERATRSGSSLTKTVIEMLIEKDQPEGRLYHDLDHLKGTWSAEEADAFDAELAMQRAVDPDMWS